MEYLLSTVNVLFVIAGIVVIVFAERLSMFERRMAEKHPSTRVTGWSGTRKGTMSWRVVGLLLVIAGSAQQLHFFLSQR